jgi:hypothetical protein
MCGQSREHRFAVGFGRHELKGLQEGRRPMIGWLVSMELGKDRTLTGMVLAD